ncbi:MAG: hypothetical protein QMC67_03615 [Candidatus Wallbacteria bacterium]
MKKNEFINMEEMSQRFGESMTNDEIKKILGGIRKKLEHEFIK